MINPAIQEVLPMLAANWWLLALIAVVVGIIAMFVPLFMPYYKGEENP